MLRPMRPMVFAILCASNAIISAQTADKISNSIPEKPSSSSAAATESAAEPAPARTPWSFKAAVSTWLDENFPDLLDGKVSHGLRFSQVVGSGHMASERRSILGAHAVSIDGPVDVVLHQGSANEASLVADDNLLPLVETRVEGGVLHVGVKEDKAYRSRHPLTLNAQLARIDVITVQGSGDVNCGALKADTLEIKIHGSGDVRIEDLAANTVAVSVHGSGDVSLSGHAALLGVAIEGSGEVDARRLAGNKAGIRIAGSGDASVWASTRIEADIVGSGNVNYRGNPIVVQHIHGSGTVQHID